MDETLRLGTTNRRLDLLAIEQGVEKECVTRPGLFVTILPAGVWNPRFKAAIQERLERLAERNGKNGEAASDRFQDPEFVVAALVLTMRGIYNADGEGVAYTPERGVAVLSDPANADVMAWIVHEAQDYGRYYTEQVEADAKNSLTVSSGKQAGDGSSETTPR